MWCFQMGFGIKGVCHWVYCACEGKAVECSDGIRLKAVTCKHFLEERVNFDLKS